MLWSFVCQDESEIAQSVGHVSCDVATEAFAWENSFLQVGNIQKSQGQETSFNEEGWKLSVSKTSPASDWHPKKKHLRVKHKRNKYTKMRLILSAKAWTLLPAVAILQRLEELHNSQKRETIGRFAESEEIQDQSLLLDIGLECQE